MNYELSLLEFLAAVGLLSPLAIIAGLQRPKVLLWTYLTVFTLFPKFVYIRFGTQLYPAVAAISGVLALIMVLATLHHGRGFTPFHRRYGIRTLFVVLALTYAVTTLVPLALNALDFGNPLGIPISTKTNGASLILFEYAVAFAGFVFLDRISAVETLFKLVTAFATLGSIEAILFYYLRLGGPLEAYAINRYGQLDGVTFGSPDALARILGIALFATLYLATKPGRKLVLLLIPLFAVALLATQNRATAVSMLVGLIVYTAMRGRTRSRSVVLVTWIFAAAAAIAGAGFGINQLLDEEVSTVRSDYKDPSNMLARVVIAQRGVEVAWHTFPFGVGAGQVPYYMNSPDVPSLFGEAEYYQNRPLYYAIRSGSLLTSVHNLYLNFIIEGGLLGVVALLFLAATIIKALRFAWRHREAYDNTPLDALFAILITIAINVGADSTFRPYALYLLLTWSAVLITYTIPALQTRLITIRYQPASQADEPVLAKA